MDLIIPFYNPPKDWEKILSARLQCLIKDIEEIPRVILVCDGEDKEVYKEALQFIRENLRNVEIIFLNRHLGKGAAIRKALASSKSKKIIVTDVDVPFDDQSLLRVYMQLQDCDVVLGSRTKSYYKQLPLSRKLISKLFIAFTIVVFGKYLGDTQAGLKGLNHKGREAYLLTKTKGFLCDFEFVRLALSQKLKITSVRIELREKVHFKPFKGGLIGKEFNSLVKIFFKE